MQVALMDYTLGARHIYNGYCQKIKQRRRANFVHQQEKGYTWYMPNQNAKKDGW